MTEQQTAYRCGVGYDDVGGVCAQTISGHPFCMGTLDLSNITIEDLALALARQPRFNGHFRSDIAWYGCAEHSVLVCDLLPPHLRRQGLLHDLHEAIAPGGDVIKPHKIVHPEFNAIEKPYADAVRARFGLPLTLHPKVKQADMAVAAIEKRDIMAAPIGFEWGELPEPPDIHPQCLLPHAAADLFLQRFYELEVSNDNTL